ncbi:MAG: response regulator [Acidimicrobiales bacterium]
MTQGDGRAVRVVLVDDDARFGELVSSVVTDDGIDVVTVHHRAAGAVDVVIREAPDVVVLDVVLPDGDGLDVVDALRSAGSSVPVVLFSSLFDRRVAGTAAALGLRYVEKADGVDALVEAVRAAAGAVEPTDR